jgi:hypothetical protein
MHWAAMTTPSIQYNLYSPLRFLVFIPILSSHFYVLSNLVYPSGFQLLQRNLQSSLFYTSCFLAFLPIFPSHFYVLSNSVYPSGYGSSFWSFPSIFVCSIFLGIFSSLIRITCPNYLNLLF